MEVVLRFAWAAATRQPSLNGVPLLAKLLRLVMLLLISGGGGGGGDVMRVQVKKIKPAHCGL